METGLNFGDVVLSLRGRDGGRHFIITGVIDKDYVCIADGKVRSAESPKKKRIKHLKFIKKLPPKEFAVLSAKLTNSNLRKVLAAATEETAEAALN